MTDPVFVVRGFKDHDGDLWRVLVEFACETSAQAEAARPAGFIIERVVPADTPWPTVPVPYYRVSADLRFPMRSTLTRALAGVTWRWEAAPFWCAGERAVIARLGSEAIQRRLAGPIVEVR